MPGHVKKSSGPDEDPTPYLVVSLEMKREDAMKPYDPKKSYWSPDGKGNYMECTLVDNDGTKATVMCGHEVNERKNEKHICGNRLFVGTQYGVVAGRIRLEIGRPPLI